jgi:DNA-binding MarR family transcriptional regulator
VTSRPIGKTVPMTDVPAPADKPVVLSPGDAADLRQAVATFVEAGADESIQRVITAVHRLSRRLNQWYDRQLVDLDISTNEYLVISELARSPAHAPLTPSQLAAATNIAPSSMTHRLDRLVERDLITREQDPDNRTRVLIQLSDAGYALFVEVIRQSDTVESDVLAGLSDDEIETMAELLEKVIAGLDL